MKVERVFLEDMFSNWNLAIPTSLNGIYNDYVMLVCTILNGKFSILIWIPTSAVFFGFGFELFGVGDDETIFIKIFG